MMRNKWLLFICLIFWSTINLTAGTRDSLLRVLAKEENSKKKALIYNQLAEDLSSNEPVKALDYAQKSVELLGDDEESADKANAYLQMGRAYYFMGDYASAFQNLKNVQDILQKKPDNLLSAKSQNIMALIFVDMGERDKAISFMNKALELYSKTDDKKGMAQVYNNLAGVKLQTENFEPKELLDLYFKASQLYKQLGDVKGISRCINNVGIVYQHMKEYDKAISQFNQALKLKREIGDVRGEVIALGGLATCYHLKNNDNEALKYFNMALPKATGTQSKSDVRNIYNGMAKCYFTMRNYKSAYDYLSKYVDINDSIINEQRVKNIEEMNARFERDKMTRENESLKQNNRISELIIEKQTSYRNLMIVITVSVLILALLIFNRMLVKKHANAVLTQQRDEIARANDELKIKNEQINKQKLDLEELNKKILASEEELKDLNFSKDKFFSIISHDLRNPFASIISFVRIMRRDISGMSPEEVSQLTDELDKSVTKIADLLENLLLWSRAQSGKLPYNPTPVDIYEIIEDNLELVSANANNKEIDLVYESGNPLEIEIDQNMINTVIRNLLNNAIKFTNIGGRIEVTTEATEDNVKISVKDNGIGMPEGDLDKVFRVGETKSRYGTADEKGSGLGLPLCREFVERHGGKIWIESKQGEGSSFNFTLPYTQEKAHTA